MMSTIKSSLNKKKDEKNKFIQITNYRKLTSTRNGKTIFTSRKFKGVI